MANLSYISPFFIVSNLENSISFYVNKLGFEIQYISPGDEPFFAIIGREQVSIMLKGNAVDLKPIPNQKHYNWARWDAFISTADPDTLFNEYVVADVTFQQTLKDDDDGLRGFEIADNDGYVLFFGRPN